MFVRGVLRVCAHCGAEVTLDHVSNIQAFGELVEYRTHCPCGISQNMVVDRVTHNAGVKWLRQVAEQRSARQVIVEPVSSEERQLLQFADVLDQMTTDDMGAIFEMWDHPDEGLL